MNKFQNVIVAVVAVGLAIGASQVLYKQSEQPKFTLEQNEAFTAWKTLFNKRYTTAAEEAHRLAIFVKNLAMIELHNAQGHSWTMAANQFADMSAKEFKAKYLGFNPSLRKKRTNAPLKACSSAWPSGVPKSLDHTKTGGVNPIKDQGQCGSCWAFSAIASLEFCYWKATQKLLSFSEQQLVDCATGKWNNNGCNGGLPDSAFKYTQKYGDMLESDYPYEAADKQCRFDASKATTTNTKGFVDVQEDCPSAFIDALSQRVISIGVDAQVWSFYGGGIFRSPFCGTKLDHGVAAVGYGQDGSSLFIKVRNSWGTRWGESGFIRLGYRMSAGKGECGVFMDPSYPTGC